MGMEASEGTLHILGFRGMVLEFNDLLQFLLQFLVHVVIFSTGRCWNIWVLELSREGVNSGVIVAEGKFVGALSMFEVGFHVHDGGCGKGFSANCSCQSFAAVIDPGMVFNAGSCWFCYCICYLKGFVCLFPVLVR